LPYPYNRATFFSIRPDLSLYTAEKADAMSLGRRRDITAILAATAVLAASLTSVVNCAGSCAASASAACPFAHGNSSDQSCHRTAMPGSSHQPERGQKCPGHYSTATLTARVTTPASPVLHLLVVDRVVPYEGLVRIHNQFSLASTFSHSLPSLSGRSICRFESLLRI
jgi:hypothetical protein